MILCAPPIRHVDSPYLAPPEIGASRHVDATLMHPHHAHPSCIMHHAFLMHTIASPAQIVLSFSSVHLKLFLWHNPVCSGSCTDLLKMMIFSSKPTILAAPQLIQTSDPNKSPCHVDAPGH